MKQFITGLYLVFFANLGIFCQTWEWQNPLPQGNTLNDIFFIDPLNGWAVGNGGAILRTTSGGGAWGLQNSGTTSDLTSICFVGSQQGWIVGWDGVILKTDDGGASWAKKNANVPNKLFDVYFLDLNVGWAVGENGAILKTTNGGDIWSGQSSNTLANLYDVHFTTFSNGYAVGENGAILRTTDGGANWSAQNSNTAFSLYDVHFVDTQTGWAAGQNGTIVKTTDGGNTWAGQNSNTSADLYSIVFASQNTGWAMGLNGTVVKTSNAGTNWTAQTTGSSSHLFGAHFNNSMSGWLCGEGGTLLETQDGGGTWTIRGGDLSKPLFGIYFINNQTGWAVGGNGTIVKTSNGGKNWVAQNSGTNQLLEDLYFLDAQVGLAVGSNGTILKTSDGGVSWSAENSNVTDSLHGVCFQDNGTAWAVGSNGRLLKTSINGNVWLPVSSGTPQSLNSVYFKDHQIGYIAGNNGIISRTTNSGTSWVPQNTNTSEDIQSIYFINTMKGWAVGKNGTLLKTTDGGTSWAAANTGISTTLFDVFFVDGSTGWAVGQWGIILATQDGGNTWALQSSGTKNWLLSTHFIDARTGWACGSSGSILAHKSNTSCRTTDSLELIKLYNATNGPNWTNKWDLAKPMNTWFGVTLNATGCVQKIVLENNNLNGTLPNLNLPELEDLNLNNNQLTGTIPDFTLPNLKFLTLFSNKLAGNIPNLNLPNLEELHLGTNQLSGSIPNFNLPSLRFLLLPDNQLSGSIPNFDLLPSLTKLNVEFNQLTGNIPDFANLPNLQIFFCGVNQLSGSIPNFSNLPNLEFFSCFLNRLSGNIPNFNLPKLEDFYCAYNQLSGSVADLNLPKLADFRANNNKISGLAQFTKMPTLTSNTWFEDSLTLYRNNLTFDDVLQNILLINNMNGRAKYAPQDSIFSDTLITRNVGQSLTIDLGIDAGLTSNVYVWTKNGAPYAPPVPNTSNSNKLIFNNLNNNDAGDYYVKVTNPNAPLLTLHSRRIRLAIGCTSLSQNISKSICPGTSFTFNNKNLTAAGIYKDTLTTFNGCDSLVTLTLSILPPPNPSLGNDQTVCPGAPAMFKAGVFTGYQWSNGESAAQITVSMPGLYTVVVTDAKGCTGTDVVELKNHPDVIARATVTDSLTCFKTQVALGSNGSSTGSNILYTWMTSDGKIDAGGNTPNPTASEGGTYQLIVRNTQTTCADTAKVAVVETSKPVANIDIKTNDIKCFGANDGVVAVNAVGSGTAPFTYRLGNGSFQSGGTFDNLAPGTYLLTVRGADGCEATGKAEIDEPDALAVSIKSPGILQGGASAALIATVSGAQGDVRYQWDGPDLSCTDCAKPQISPQFNALYMLTVTDEKGCTAVANVLVSVKSELGPDVITPGNEDGQNDKLIFDDLDKEPAASENDITIFNRWGQKVFTARPYLNDWKGTDDKGRELPEGTYYYVLNLRDGVKNAVHGSVLIVR